MKICFVAFRSIHTKRYLDWFVRRGHEVHLITAHLGRLTGVAEYDVSFHTSLGPRLKRVLTADLNVDFVRKVRLVLRLRRLVREIAPDILHLQTLYFPMYYAALAGFKPMVVSTWDGDVIWTPQRSWFHRAFVRQALQKADAVTVTSEVMKNICLKHYSLPEEKIHEIRGYGPDLKQFYPGDKDRSLMRRLGIEGCTVVFSTRALSNGYNIDAVLRAVPLVLKEVPEAKFVFAWPGGDLVDSMADLARQLGVADSVRMVGTLDYEELPGYYRSSDVAVSVTSPDSAPASLFESMASGLPVVVGDDPSITQFIKDGWNGLVVPPKDHAAIAGAIVRLIKDADTRRLFIERNLPLVREKANRDVEMAKIESLYRDLLDKVGARRKG